MRGNKLFKTLRKFSKLTGKRINIPAEYRDYKIKAR